MRNSYLKTTVSWSKVARFASSFKPSTGIRAKQAFLSILLVFYYLLVQAQTTPVNGTTSFNTVTRWDYVEYGRSNNATTGFTALNVGNTGWDISGYSNGPGSMIIAGENWDVGSDGGLVYLGSEDGSAHVISMQFKANDGKLFDLNTIDLGYDLDYGKPVTSTPLIITGYRNGNPVSGASFAVPVFDPFKTGTWSRGINIASNTNFKGIDEFRITASTADVLSAVDVDNINATNFRTAVAAGVTLNTIPTLSFNLPNGTNMAASITDGQFGATSINDATIEMFSANASGTANGRMLSYWDNPLNGGVVGDHNNGDPMFIIREQEGNTFSFQGIELTEYLGGAYTIHIEGFRNNVSTGSVDVSVGSDFIENFTTTQLPASFFGNIDQVQISNNAGGVLFLYYNKVKVGSPITTLPVTWSSFTGTRKGQAVELKWSTATEQNTNDYIVQHSLNGHSWNGIATIKAAGNSSMVQAYSFIHTTPVKGINFYRLQQRDRDGRGTYSRVVSVDFREQHSTLNIYPNPVTNGTLQLKLQGETTMKVYNSAGHLVLQQEGKTGTNTLELPHLPAGLYTIRAGVQVSRFVIQ
jgi:hypothetical protein